MSVSGYQKELTLYFASATIVYKAQSIAFVWIHD